MVMASLSTGLMSQEDSAIGSPTYLGYRGPVELLPNPDFVFPARPDTSSTPQTFPSSIARRPRSEQNLAASASNSAHRTRASVSALPLPSFTFNPAGPTNDAAFSQSTPPLSPSLNSPSTPSRSRHRRGGSELIGEDRATGNVNLVASSPKSSVFSAPPVSINLGPPAGRRHAHRRSGAISCHDLASIMQSKDSNVQTRSGSAPTSPLNIDDRGFDFTSQPQHNAGNSISSICLDEPLINDGTESSENLPTRRSFSRTRVGFADRVEYIRPLSTISSETESSMSTIRGHSVNGSWSSVVSINNLSPARRCRPSLDTTFEDDDTRRPNTSQAVLSSSNMNNFSFTLPPTVEERPKSEAGLSTSPLDNANQPKRKSFTWWDGKAKQAHVAQPGSEMETETSLAASPPSSPKIRHSLDSDQETITNALTGPGQKKPRKVRSWAHSLISRKHKSKKDLRPATPPTSTTNIKHNSDDDRDSVSSWSDTEQSDPDFNFDQDNTITIIDETPQLQQHALHAVSPTIRSTPITADNSGPVIDLDIAMSPFREQLSPNGRASRQARSRQSMHSASITSGAFNYASQHRRTESAPQLKPFELRNPPSFTSSVMPDVFEEEDEELEAEQNRDANDLSVASNNVQSAENNLRPHFESSAGDITHSETNADSWPCVTGFGNARRQKSGAMTSESGSRPASLAIEPADGVQQIVCDSAVDLKIVEMDYDACSPNTNDDRVGTPLSDYKIGPPPPLRYSIPLPPDQIMTPGTASDASAYSPFFSPSQASLVGPRVDTGASSINETSSFCFGEPGPELRVSVDDVPSLSSSRSTMTSPAVHGGLPGSSGGTAPSIYSMRSATTTDFTRQKRGSIASLSRLVADRFERSKLSIESRPMTSSPESTIKEKKPKHRHRLSRLMQFWRSKEST